MQVQQHQAQRPPLTQQIRLLINQAANNLPVVTELTHELHYVDGEELIEQGHTELENGQKVEIGKKYQQNMPVVMSVNHKRRMIQAYKDNGEVGVLSYIRHIGSLAKRQN